MLLATTSLKRSGTVTEARKLINIFSLVKSSIKLFNVTFSKALSTRAYCNNCAFAFVYYKKKTDYQ